jgi:RNA polymerase sigma-70 factor (ECF subfamily)
MNQPQQQAQRLAETYADPILRLSYAYLKNTHDAQDVCQTVFVKLLTEPRAFENPQHERAYVLRMAANACKDILKSPWRRRTCGLDAVLEVPAPEAEEGTVLSAVNTLPPHYRAVIYLFYYEGYQAAEIGAILGIPTATVHTRLARGRAKLKTILGGTEYEQSV